MDTKKHLTDEEFARMLEDGYDFEDVIGQKVTFKVQGMKVENRWNIDAVATFAVSADGIQWSEKEIPVTTSDDDYDSALATAMLAMANAINSPRFLAGLRRDLDAYETLQVTKDIQ